jgi:septal ring factor EnvC (AmiA/AmiB activator)
VTRRLTLVLAPVLLAAAGPAVPEGSPEAGALGQARAEQASAEAEARRLEAVAAKARGQASVLQAQQAAATQAIAAAEARITASGLELALVSATLAERRRRLESEQRPISMLLAGLAMMGRRPPLLTIADRGSIDDFVKVRVLLDSTMPVIRRRTAALSAELAEGQRLERAAIGARQELARSRDSLAIRRQQFASLEERALEAATRAGGQALNAGDVALAAGEDVARLRDDARGTRAAWALAADLAAADPAPPRPANPQGPRPPAALAYELPAAAPLDEGLGEVSASGVQSRGITLATTRGTAIAAPAAGVVRFSGAFRSHDGVVILDHGGGWKTLLLNVSSTVAVGERVSQGAPIGRALGPISVELSQNGRRMSPALISGSSQSLSNKRKAG